MTQVPHSHPIYIKEGAPNTSIVAWRWSIVPEIVSLDKSLMLMILLNFCFMNSAPHCEIRFWKWKKTWRLWENSCKTVQNRYKKYAKNAYELWWVDTLKRQILIQNYEIKIEIELKLNASRLTISSSSFYFPPLHKVDSAYKIDFFLQIPFSFFG